MSDDVDEEDRDTESVAVKSYVPAYQKELWKEDAEEMDMSLSEFVRCMVQAGRRGFDTATVGQEATTETASEDRLVGLDEEALRERIHAMLARVDHLTYEEIVLLVTGDLEREVADALMALQSENEAVHTREGYHLAGEDQ